MEIPDAKRKGLIEKPTRVDEIRRGQAHVWSLPVTQDISVIEPFLCLLDEAETARFERITHEQGRREYLLAHILCRGMLAHFGDRAARDWEFSNGPHGRPEPVASSLRFNISHARGLVACAVTRENDIGVDVEWLERTNQIDDIAAKKFAPDEAARVESAQPEHRKQIFLSFWTLKESYIKAIGRGLAEPLDGFAFDLEPPKIRFLRDNGKPDCWQFALLQPTPAHLLALALARPAGEAVEISTRHLTQEELIAMMTP